MPPRETVNTQFDDLLPNKYKFTLFCTERVNMYRDFQVGCPNEVWIRSTHAHKYPSILTIDPFHARHSIAVTVVMYHMTYERWRSSKKTESWIQAKCIAVRKMTRQLSRRLPQVSIAAFTEDFRIAEWLRSLTSNSAEWTNEAVAMTWRHWNVALERGLYLIYTHGLKPSVSLPFLKYGYRLCSRRSMRGLGLAIDLNYYIPRIIQNRSNILVLQSRWSNLRLNRI